MISIIVCSKNIKMLSTLKNNISETIGNIQYELITINNSDNKYSIFQAYNEGVRKAKYDILCFMHEDIIFRNNDWGKKVKEVLSDSSIGIVGVIGGCYIGKMSLSWYTPGCCKGHIIQGNSIKGKYTTYSEEFQNNDTSNYVAAVDGLWMCARKELFNTGKLKWDDKTYTGFHLYDFDVCMQAIALGLNNVICKDIEIEHTSIGTKNEAFYDAVLEFHKKWDSHLPIISKGFSLPNDFDETKIMLNEYCTLAKGNFQRIKKLSHWAHKLVSKIIIK